MAHKKALELLSEVFGNRLSRSPLDLEIHGTSEAHFPVTAPDAVVYVNSVVEVQKLIGVCAECECPVVAWGTGTSLEGHTLAPRGGVSVDFSQMNRVLKINADDMTVVVEPGVTREALNEELRHTGLFFPVDPGANASLGGMAATRASGTTTVRYGTMHNNVLSLSVVLSDGRYIETGNQAPKSSAGYDLTSLFVGSEGTLGLITQLTLRLHPQPEAISAGIVAFNDMDSAVSAVIQTIQLGLPMARIEFVDSATTSAFNAYANADMAEVPHLLFELHGSEANVADSAEIFNEICTDHGGQDFKWSTKTEERTSLWAMRHKAYYAVLASRPGSTAVITDICVPISKLGQAVAETRDDISQSSIKGPIFGHIGDGNFHAILLIDPDSIQEKAEAMRIGDKMAARALSLGGTCSGEHGVGMGKLKFMDAQHGLGWDVMGQIKRQLDPLNILNPGKLVRQN
jgi:D-lactate dehydrogenase (cytochrome)